MEPKPNMSATGANSSIINGNDNKINNKYSISTNIKIGFFFGGFLSGVVTSILANYIYDLIK